ncbi:hypothetical protein [Coleofasciculus sp. H7-2]|uniref:hypothetical protein n=1 Tax=Coleofasciculus sp. H7-2 TaxID=3351545 RepID=UPI00366EE12A
MPDRSAQRAIALLHQTRSHPHKNACPTGRRNARSHPSPQKRDRYCSCGEPK